MMRIIEKIYRFIWGPSLKDIPGKMFLFILLSLLIVFYICIRENRSSYGCDERSIICFFTFLVTLMLIVAFTFGLLIEYGLL